MEGFEKAMFNMLVMFKENNLELPSKIIIPSETFDKVVGYLLSIAGTNCGHELNSSFYFMEVLFEREKSSKFNFKKQHGTVK